MFWPAVTDGLEILSHWRVWLALGVFAAAWSVVVASVHARSPGDPSPSKRLEFLEPVWNAASLTVLLLVLAPVLLFREDTLSFDLVEFFSLVEVTKIFLLGLVAGIVAVVPRARVYLEFVQATVITGAVMYFGSGGEALIWPGWQTALGLVLAGVVICHMASWGIATAVASAFLGKGGVMVFVSFFAGVILSVIPAFFYGGWLRIANGL